MLNTTCPNCGSTNTQAVQVLLAHGTTTGTIKGGGVSLSQGGGLGAHTFSGDTTQKTELAKRFTLEPRPGISWGAMVATAVGGLLLYLSISEKSTLWSVVFGLVTLISVLAFFGLKAQLPEQIKAWEARAAYLRHAWFCHQCGKDWHNETE